MKPFNLEEAKAGKAVCTRDGRKVRILAFDVKIPEYPIAAAISLSDCDGKETIHSYSLEGTFYHDGEPSNNDLMMNSEKRRGWIGILRPSPVLCGIANTTPIFATKEDIDDFIFRFNYTKHIILIKQIEWEE